MSDLSHETQRGAGRPRLEFRVFGSTSLTGRPKVETLLVQPKRVAVLAYLVLARPRGFHRRDRVVSLFWPEHAQEHARAALRAAVHRIRQSAGEDAVVSRGDEELSINRDLLWCDAVEFDEAIGEQAWFRAHELYRGELLGGFFADAPGFERWLETERQRYRDVAADAAWKLAQQHESSDQLTLAAQWARRVAALAPADERVLRRVLLLLERAGDRVGAVRVFEEFSSRLKVEYQVDPSPETLALVRRLRGA